MLPPQVKVIGIAWYKRADYPRILDIMTDSHKLPTTFDKWQKLAEDTERTARQRGLTVVRAHIDPENFVAWCARNNLQVGAEGRSRWGAERAMHHVTGNEH